MLSVQQFGEQKLDVPTEEDDVCKGLCRVSMLVPLGRKNPGILYSGK